MSKLIDNSSGVAIGGEVANDIVGGVTPAVLFIENIGGVDVLAEDHENFGYSRVDGLYVLHESTVGFLQYPVPLEFSHTVLDASSFFGGAAVVRATIQDEATDMGVLVLDTFVAIPEINHISGTHTAITMFRGEPIFNGDGNTSALTYFRADNPIINSTENIGTIYGLYTAFSGMDNYGYYNAGTASNLLGATGSKSYMGSNSEVVFFYDTDNYWKFNQNTVSPLGMWVNSTQGQFDFIVSGDTDTDLLYVNTINDTIGIGTDGSSGLGKLDIRPISTSISGLFMRLPSTPTVPYVRIQDSTSNDIFRIRRGPSQISDTDVQQISGLISSNIGAIADSVPNAFWVVNGYGSAFVLNDTSTSESASLVAGSDSGSQVLSNRVLFNTQIFGNDNVGGINILFLNAAIATGNWTTASTPFSHILTYCPTGSNVPFVGIRISSDDGVIVNDAPDAACTFRVKSPSTDYLFYVDPGTDRVGIKSSSPGSTFDVQLPGGTDDGIQVQANTSFHSGDFYRALTSAGNNILQFKLNNLNPNDADSILYIGDPTAVQTSYIENNYGGAITNSSFKSPIIASVLRTTTSTERPVLAFGIDTGAAVQNTNILGDFLLFGPTGASTILPYTFDRLTATANWSSGSGPFDRKMYTASTTTGTPNLRIWLKSNDGMFVNSDKDQNYDFVFLSSGSDYLIHADAQLNRVGILTNSPSYEFDVDGIIRARDGLRVGDGSSGVDFTITFDGENSDGILKWLEDESYLQVPNLSNGTINTALLGQLSGLNYIVSTGTLPILGSISTSNLLSSSIFTGKSSGVAVANNESLHQDIVYGNKDSSTLQGNIYHTVTADDSAGWATGSAGFRQDWYVVADGATTPYATPAITIRQSNRVGIQNATPNSGFDPNTSIGVGHQIFSTSTTLGDFAIYEYNGSGGHTFTLPALATTSGRVYEVKNTGTGAVTVDANGSEGIYTNSSVLSFAVYPGQGYKFSNSNTNQWIVTAAYLPGSSGLFDHYADGNNSGTTETDLYTDTLPAGILSVNGQKIKAHYGGIFTGAALSTQQIKVYFGGTQIYDSGALSIGAATNNWTVNVSVIRESSSVVRCNVWVNSDFATLFPYSTYTRITGLTLSNTQIIKITGTAAGAGGASNQITAKEGYGEWLPQAL